MKPCQIVAVVPMKPLHLAKSRLADRLTPTQRAALSLNILGRVIGAALQSPADQVWVIGGDDVIRQRVISLGADWYEDEGVGLNDTLWQTFQRAFASGLAPMYLPADLPFLVPKDIVGMVEASNGGRRLTLSPARCGGGTNGIIVPVGSPFRPGLGLNSFRHHKEQAEELRLSVDIYDCPGLGFDLDTPDDLVAYEEMESGFMAHLLTEESKRGVDEIG